MSSDETVVGMMTKDDDLGLGWMFFGPSASTLPP